MKDDNFDERAAQLQAEADADRERAAQAAEAATQAGELVPAVEGMQQRVLARREAEGALVEAPPANAIIAELLAPEADEREMSAAQTEAAILKRILESPDDEDVFMPPEAVSVDDLSRQQIIVRGFHVNESTFETGPGWYIAIEAEVVETREKIVIVTGMKRIIAQVWMKQMRGQLPAECWVRPSKRPNRHGAMMYSLDSRNPEDWR